MESDLYRDAFCNLAGQLVMPADDEATDFFCGWPSDAEAIEGMTAMAMAIHQRALLAATTAGSDNIRELNVELADVKKALKMALAENKRLKEALAASVLSTPLPPPPPQPKPSPGWSPMTPKFDPTRFHLVVTC